jgi:hypothetical protein
MDNMKAAVANIFPRPFQTAPLAGTIACPACGGDPVIHRLTPNSLQAFGLEEPWDFNISKRLGRFFRGRAGRPEERRRLYLEHPSRAPTPSEMPGQKPRKKDPAARRKEQQKAEAEAAAAAVMGGGFTISHRSAYTLEDYVLNYVSDEDEPPIRGR